MARIQGTCVCDKWDCDVHFAYAPERVAADGAIEQSRLPKQNSAGWVDQLTTLCRPCEIGHGKRWGHHNPGLPAEEGSQIQKDTAPPGL